MKRILKVVLLGFYLATMSISASVYAAAPSMPPSVQPKISVYTASGAISTTDTLAIINSASAVTMTLGSGSYNGQFIQIKRYGAGTVTITANIDGNSGGSITMTSVSYKENVNFKWSTVFSTWLLQ